MMLSDSSPYLQGYSITHCLTSLINENKSTRPAQP
jgi:hypothetical protein